ncbi:hypothetical protein FXO38_06388 [Capsicum annuum]|uniref:Uncharacterized protein n=1 Tax=Capsicum annuum TaxID=4072 RepID=A0A2G3A6I2_CAPAN|nr:hypothetical protein FXO37_26669 [Capsicum annuum]KAF3671897.1 hypothetical protein FXO38_06388 [Capsicum annuum]PHT89844.1 hypothetical protein T459_04957 [Capsicum annuum]
MRKNRGALLILKFTLGTMRHYRDRTLEKDIWDFGCSSTWWFCGALLEIENRHLCWLHNALRIKQSRKKSIELEAIPNKDSEATPAIGTTNKYIDDVTIEDSDDESRTM